MYICVDIFALEIAEHRIQALSEQLYSESIFKMRIDGETAVQMASGRNFEKQFLNTVPEKPWKRMVSQRAREATPIKHSFVSRLWSAERLQLECNQNLPHDGYWSRRRLRDLLLV